MLIIAHRGYSSAYPENTALAFERAIEAGADFIETDLRFARDGALVCSHDADLKRVAGDTRSIGDLGLAELKAVRLPHGLAILGLEEVLALARGRARVMLDVKVTTPEMIDAVLTAVERTGMTRDVVYGARTVEHLRAVSQRSDAIALLGMPAQPERVPEFLAERLRAVRYWEEDVTAERAALVHRAGRELWVTAGLRARHEAPGYITLERATALARLGVDALLVNDPPLALAVRT